jgi:hypothetical protein
MIGVTVAGYTQTCTTNSGGISRLWVGDAEDFNLTSGTTNAQTSGYSAIARRTGATHVGGADLFEIVLLEDSGKANITQSIQNGSAQWAYALEGQLLYVQQTMIDFAMKLDAASLCGQLIWVIQDNNGKLWVIGEKWVDASAIVKFKVKQDGSVVDFGQALNSFHGMNFKAQGNYRRPAYEFTAGFTALSAMWQ